MRFIQSKLVLLLENSKSNTFTFELFRYRDKISIGSVNKKVKEYHKEQSDSRIIQIVHVIIVLWTHEVGHFQELPKFANFGAGYNQL